ncbi:MAG TPA: recombinase family protein [Solirubrobacterales bacterium]|nr:recombinase family protein [Solirubrobacterales bacterium]
MQGKGSNGRPAIIYAAKSSPDERGSIPDQIKKGQELAEAEGYEVVAVYHEENVSAYHGERGPELAAALKHAAKIRAALIVWHSDRLARGDGETNRHLVEILLDSMRKGYRLRSVEDDRTFESVSSAAQMGDRNYEDSRRKGRAVRDGLARRRAAGKRIGGGSYALTWRRNENDERETIPDPDKAPVVDRINAEYLAGRPILQIVKGLNADKIPSHRNGKWSTATVASILENPLYAGLVRDGERLIEGQHEPIISRERYEEALRLRQARALTHRRGRSSLGQHLFRQGFLRHAECGGAMCPRTNRNKNGTLRETYRCHTHYTDPASCDLTSVSREPIDTAVYEFFRRVALDVEQTRTQMGAAIEHKIAEVSGLLASAEQQATTARERLERVKGDYLAGELLAPEWRELREELEPAAQAADSECERLASQLAEVEAGPSLANVEDELMEQLARIRAALAGKVIDASGIDAVRAALMGIFDCFLLHRGVPDGRANLELVGDGYWIEPVIAEHAVEGYDEKLRPVLARKPLGQAGNNFNETFVWL